MKRGLVRAVEAFFSNTSKKQYIVQAGYGIKITAKL